MDDDTDRREETDRSDDSRISTDEETIRRWAEKHDAVPVEHSASDEEASRVRVIPEENVGEPHERAEWDTFFEVIEEWDYVVIYHGEEGVEPFEVVERDEAIARADTDREEFEEQLLEGKTVTSTIRETTVVESVVVEEATIESELVGSEVIDQRVLDAELVGRECTNCDLVEDPEMEEREWFDTDRYLDALGETQGDRTTMETLTADGIPYSPELDVEETWTVTRELTERFTVESHIEDVEIVESDTIEDHDIDVRGLHRNIVESGLLDVELSPEEVLTEYDVESEVSRDDRIRTHFDRTRLIQDEVVDRKRLHADVVGGDFLEMETVRSEDVETELVGEDEPETADAEGEEAGPSGAEAAVAGDASVDEPDEATASVRLTGDEIGKTVVDARGENVGMVTDVEGETTMYVDPHPSITDRIQAMLDWGDVDEGDLPIQTDQIERVTDDQIELKRSEDLG